MSRRKKTMPAEIKAPERAPFADRDDARAVPMTITAGQLDDLVGFNNYGLEGFGVAALALNALFHGANELKLLRHAAETDDGEELGNMMYMLALRLETAAEIAAKAIQRERKEGNANG